MDYDDNDFQSQNLHLAGEGSTRFPPVLRQYALPKFDFDDSIEGHVRFDSLVETEVFLGIESNEDNQWIEDFSRGSSGVEFSTSAAEGCCILRRKNVWSDATSSESVEMLLKSVGQEDFTPPHATTEESNVCDKFKQMEPTVKHGNTSFSEMENIMNLEPTSVPDGSHEEFLGVFEPSIRHCDSRFSEIKSAMNLEATPLPVDIHEKFSTLKEDTSGEMPPNLAALENFDGSLIHVDSTLGCQDGCSPKVEGFQITDWNSNLLVQTKVDSLVKISLQADQWEDSCASGNLIDGVASSTNLTGNSFEMNIEHVKHLTMIESSDGSPKGNGKQEDDESGPRREGQRDDHNIITSASVMKAVEEKVDTGITNDEKHCNVISKVNYESHVGEARSEIVHPDISAESGRFNDKVFWKSGEWGDQSEVGDLPVISEGETTFDRHAVKGKVSHIDTGMATSQESEMDPVVSTICANTVVEEIHGLQMNSDMLVTEASSSLSIRENSEVSKGEECSTSPVRENSSLPPVNSGASSEEIHATATLRGEYDASGVHAENLKAEDVKEAILADPAHICEDTIHHGKDNVHSLHVSVSEEESTRLTYESVHSNYQVDGGVPSSSFGEHRTEHNLVVNGIQYNESHIKEPASIIYLDNSSVEMSVSSYDADLSIGDGVITDKCISQSKGQLLKFEVECVHMDENEVEVSGKERQSTMLESSQLEARSCPTSYAAENTLIVIGENMSSDKANHLVTQKANCNIEAQTEPEAEVSNEVSENSIKEMDVFPIPCELAITVDETVDIMSDSKQIPASDQILTPAMASLSQETQESNGKTMKEQGDVQSVSVSEGNNYDQAVATVTDTNNSKQIPASDQILTPAMASLSQETQESNGKTMKQQGDVQSVSLSEGKNYEQAVATVTDTNNSKQIPASDQNLTPAMASLSQETQESNGKTMKEQGDIQSVSVSEGKNYEQGVATVTDTNYSKQIPASDQILTPAMASLSQETQESNGKTMKEQGDIQSVAVFEGKNYEQGVATVTDTNSGCQTNKDLSSYIASSHSVVQESVGCTISGKPALPNDAKILSSSDYENKFSKGSSMQTLLVSETTDADAFNEWPTSHDPKNLSASENENSLPLEPKPLEDLSNRDSSIDRQSSPAISASKGSSIVDGSLSSSGLGLCDPQDATCGSPQASGRDIMGCHNRGSTERRTRRSSVKGTGKESIKKGNVAKTVKSSKQSERGEKSSNLLSSPGVFPLVQSNESEHHGHVECSSVKPFVFVTPSTSSLPDLNSSASSSAMFQQRFTDLQQVQLRAQIFVYGALIQGIAPDEAYMSSAFGGPDSGRSLWENAWRVCIERLHGQKSYPTSSETSLQSHSGAKGIDQASKQSTPQSKVLSSSVGRVSSKGTTAVVNSMISPSPLWNISTPSEALQSVVPRGPVMEYQQALSPFHSFQTPPMRNFIGVSNSWLSQAPFRSPWVATSQISTPEVTARLSALPITEPVHLTPLKEPFIPHSSGFKLPTTMFPGSSPLLDTKRTSVIRQNSSDPKPRKRRKIPVSENSNQIAVQSSSLVEQVSFPTTVHSQSTSVSMSNSSDFSSKDASEKLILPILSMPSTSDLRNVSQDVEQKDLMSEETLSKVKEARQLAEDASEFAAGAVQHSQEIWSRLDRQSNSGLESGVLAKISSAALAIAAAVAVAKAAAAAAKVASDAALQAKLMADEAFASMDYENSGHSHDFTAYSIMNSVGKGNSSSKLRVEGETNSSSLIFAAKEAARRRVEATTAASKQAENMDAIVKAAELAAEAVSQAGKIVAMGEPLPLSEMVKLGPDGCLKVPQLSSELVIRADEMQLRVDSFGDGANSSAKPSKEPCVANESQVTVDGRTPLRGVTSKDSIEDQQKLVDCMAVTGILAENDLRGKGHKVFDLAKTIGVVPESEFEARSTQSMHEKVIGVGDNAIKEGSCVEILKEGNGLKAAWFTASVSSLKDGKAYVCYNELQQEGSGPLKEWVPLESEEDQAPKIRISYPVSAKHYEGTRKRRRADMTDHAWSVGDRVDAWVHDSWCEGVVTEKNQKDGTTITVHFPANEETSAVKIWHLRPSLMWQDGKWVEWSINRGIDNSLEGDMPQEKRLKLGSSSIKAKGKDNIPKLANVVEPGLEDSRILVLSANDRAFNVGKNTQNESKSYPLRTVRTGLQEGSRVIFGVPKPGKKRKFMDVSKHYVANQNKGTEKSDSVNLVKYLMPQGAGPRRLKNPPKPRLTEKREAETREKRKIEMKPKSYNKFGKPPSISSGRTMPPISDADSEIHDENDLGKNNAMQSCSSGEVLEGSTVLSSLAPSGEATKKLSSSNLKLEQAIKGKFAPGGGGKLTKIDEDKVSNTIKSMSEIEPRRSVRRIQPTSRLLEGLQSSLTVSKNPAQDKGKKRLIRPPASKANNI